MTDSHGDLRLLLGVYVLGGIDEGERLLLEQHLAACADCRAELAGLRSLPAALAGLTEDEAMALAAPGPEQVQEAARSLMAELARRRRRLRRRMAALVAGVAAACLVIGAAVGPVLLSPRQETENYTMTASSGLQVELDLVHKAWGTELAVDGTRLPEEGVLSLWLTDRTGMDWQVATWQATPTGKVRLVAATATMPEDITCVEIRNWRDTPVAAVYMHG
ncbi:zf-HC2 domain-containing protein [Arthrobacter mobilis]|uniref:Anti-sigma factor n=1 Tax=Arthrobacter mobilis TaxID=2724944 RepID=A0A7X6K672_9MICC|nr:zf-HC2 domain-containing protein [Arthrobacter mobilis]NKX55254.1 anti-sigma factor [Arthrobacter mobilis]